MRRKNPGFPLTSKENPDLRRTIISRWLDGSLHPWSDGRDLRKISFPVDPNRANYILQNFFHSYVFPNH